MPFSPLLLMPVFPPLPLCRYLDLAKGAALLANKHRQEAEAEVAAAAAATAAAAAGRALPSTAAAVPPSTPAASGALPQSASLLPAAADAGLPHCPLSPVSAATQHQLLLPTLGPQQELLPAAAALPPPAPPSSALALVPPAPLPPPSSPRPPPFLAAADAAAAASAGSVVSGVGAPAAATCGAPGAAPVALRGRALVWRLDSVALLGSPDDLGGHPTGAGTTLESATSAAAAAASAAAARSAPCATLERGETFDFDAVAKKVDDRAPWHFLRHVSFNHAQANSLALSLATVLPFSPFATLPSFSGCATGRTEPSW